MSYLLTQRERELIAALTAAADQMQAQLERALPPKLAHLAAQSPHVLDARAAIAKATGGAT